MVGLRDPARIVAYHLRQLNHVAVGGYSAGDEVEVRLECSDIMNPTPEIKPGQSVELLKELHILTRDGKLNQDSRRKLKQVYHLCNFIEPLLNKVLARQDTLTLADHGAGKSYLGFILYDLYLKARAGSHIYGIETRDELV